jgi:hypothetical protein
MPDMDGRARLLLTALPAGLAAVAASPAGESPRDRRGRLKARFVDLIPADDPLSGQLDLSVGDLQWVLSRDTRRWESVTRRFGADRSRDIAFGLVRHGAVVLRCTVTEALRLGRPVRWTLTGSWAAHAADLRQERQERNAAWQQRARQASDAVLKLDAALATALTRARGHEPRLPVLVYAAEDLAQGRVHHGPRAFSHAHFADTKERDNAAEILRAVGASDDTITALGIARSGYIGVGGPVYLPGCEISKLRGPVLLRANDPALARATAHAESLALLLVENLQAAESTCDRYPGLVVVHTSGQPDDDALPFISRIAASAARVIIIPDADLGGARIAERIVTALPDVGRAELIDIGTQPHPLRDPFGPVSMNGLQALAAAASPVALFAAACLARGYPVEQEAASLAAIGAALKA